MSVKNSRMRIWLTFGTTAAILVIGVVAGAQNLTVKGTITGEQNTYFATAGGMVGIGTTSPAQKLHVAGNQKVDGWSYSAAFQASTSGDVGPSLNLVNPAKPNGTAQTWTLYNMTGGYGNSLQFYVYDSIGCGGGLCASRMTLTDAGRLGIGTQTPAAPLHVQGGGGTTGDIRVQSTSPTIRFEDSDESTYWFHNNSNTFYLLWDAGLNGDWVSPYPVYFSGRSAIFNGGTLQVNAGSNRVGVGVDPSYKLHVAGDIYANGGWLRVSGDSGLYFESYGGGWHMQDSTWIRSYNGKPVYMSAGFDTSSPAGVSCGGGLGGGYNFRVCGTQQVTSDLTVSGNAHMNNNLYLYGYLRGNNYGFGGMYTYDNISGCIFGNPYTGGCSCPAGNWAQPIDTWNYYDKYSGTHVGGRYWCVR
jgi:hypothetical protein